MQEHIEKIWLQTIRKRLDPNSSKLKDHNWKFEQIWRGKINDKQFEERVQELLDQGLKVYGGYYTTSVRNYHNRTIYYKVL